MAGDYLPLELVHAHLPANPPPPNSIRTVNATDNSRPRSTDSPLHREHASSAALHPTLNVQARVIDNGHVLELRQLDLHRSQAGEPLRVAFDQPLLDLGQYCMSTDVNGISIFVSTAFTIYRLRFSVRKQKVLFETGAGWLDSWTPEEEGFVRPLAALHDGAVATTRPDGSLVRIECGDTGEWGYQQFRPAVSRLRLPSFIAGRSNDEDAVSFAVRGDVVFTLSRNGRLRVWNAGTGENVKTYDLEAPIEAGPQHIRLVPHPHPKRYAFMLVVHRPGAFVVYRATAAGELTLAGERECRDGALVGFDIVNHQGYRLHATFDRGVIQHESVLMDDIFQFTNQIQSSPPEWSTTVVSSEDLDPAYFDNLLGLAPPDPAAPYENYDISNTFLEHLFHPGRFSPLTLTTTLCDYTDESIGAASVQGSLSERYREAVGVQVEMEISPQTGAPEVERYRAELKREWLKVWARARELDNQGRWPIATSQWSDQAFVVTREGLSAPVVQDVAGVIERFSQDGSPASISGYAELQDPKERSALVAIVTAVSALQSTLDAATERPLTAFTEELQEVFRNGLQEPVEDLGARIWSDHIAPYVSEDDVDRLRRDLSNCSDIEHALDHALELLAVFTASSADTVFSGLGNALLASNVQVIIASRHRFAQSALLVALFILSEVEETSFELVNRAIDIWHRFDILKWAASQRAEEAVQQRKRKDDISSTLSGLQVGGADNDGYDTSSSLLHHLLATQLPSDCPDIASAASTWLANVQIDETFGMAILQSGVPLLAGEYADRLPASAGVEYIRGRAALKAGDTAVVVQSFDKAATGVADGSLLAILPEATGLFEFYQHVALICPKTDCHAATLYFGQHALRLQPESQHKPLWVAVFLAAKKLRQYEQAYTIVAAVPSKVWQGEFLDALVTEMCENQSIGRLISFSFIDLAQKVESRLRFLAENSDPLKKPNYYEVLYAWYIARGDYRSAGDIMYRQAQRYKHVSQRHLPLHQSFKSQAKSFSAAINALQLLDRKSAWIIVEGRPISAPGVKEWKRRKVTGYIPEDQYAPTKKPVFILDLGDIRAEYAMVLARISLLEDGYEHTVGQTPAEVVAMAIQRGRYDLALSTASQGGVAMKEIFISLATRCVELASPNTPVLPDAIAYLHTSPLTNRLRGSDAALSLRYLEKVLQQYDSADTHYAYRTAVANTFFALNSNKRGGWRMPAWLVSWEMERNPEGWIGMAVKWGWIEEALDWSAEMLRRATPPELLDDNNAAAIPYNLLDRVLAAAEEGDEKDDKRVQAKATTLKHFVDTRVARLKEREGR